MGDNGVYISTYERKGTKHPPYIFARIVLYLKISYWGWKVEYVKIIINPILVHKNQSFEQHIWFTNMIELFQ